MGSETTIIHVIPESVAVPAEGEPQAIGREVVSHFDQRAESIIADARSLFAEEGLDVKADILRYRDPLDAIQDFAKDGEYDLIVMGNGEDDRWELDTVGGVAEKVASGWKGSVLIVKKTCGFSRISVVVGAGRGGALFDLAANLAKDFGSQFKVISAPSDGKASADALLETHLQKAKELGLAAQGEAMPKRNVKQLNGMLTTDLTQLLLLRRPAPGIVGRIFGGGDWAYKVLMSCPCSVMICS
jgi:nucleotide-binding universal stress UspA family protein